MEPTEIPVTAVMSGTPFTVPPDTPLPEVFERFSRAGCTELVVSGPENHFLGFITALDLLGDEFVATVLTPREHSVVREYTDQVHDLLEIRVIPDGVTTFGTVPVDPKGAAEQGILLIGCDCGTNFSDAHKLKEIGADLYENHGVKRMAEVIDHVCARMALRFIDVALEEKLLIPEKTAIGFSGRAATSGKKPEYIYHGIRDRNLYANPYEHVIFVEDALARGASLMARCMCSLGRPQNPIGGCRGGPCILGRRRKVER